MSRRRRAVKRKIVADPKYASTLVARLVSILMLEGKKSIAQKVVYRKTSA
jgi:small subunit ribosomal protein S7